MTDYLRSIAAYVASQHGHTRCADDRLGPPTDPQLTTPDSSADTTNSADSTVDRGWTR